MLKNFRDTSCPQTLSMASQILHHRNPACLSAFSHPAAQPSVPPLYFNPILPQPYCISSCSLNQPQSLSLLTLTLSVSSAQVLFSPSFPLGFSQGVLPQTSYPTVSWMASCGCLLHPVLSTFVAHIVVHCQFTCQWQPPNVGCLRTGTRFWEKEILADMYV